ncbi:DUF4126 domain-containing protein [Arsenicicoccus sp. oral taxon 190]|uniref:DUF4126 domain-containing protein n=1 Tax=Arsenicicoccus sp. oral taxon 190 TaxID=1658671 RepID=UPI00067A3430|nr:DUF4126 domain-containing protein [Arsenicicoccus sp. oral taxon 190]AKT52036.1 membrane protein [Arsenicicoccus sp. oral taxon 190]
MGTELLPMVFTSGWASGINAYAVVLVMGLAGRFFSVDLVPGVLTRTDVLIASAVLFLLEMFADKIPYVDTAWDSVHTVVRPAVGATLGYLLAGHEGSGLEQAFAAATGGFSALASHGVKAGIRAGVNASPEPVSNIAISSAEDVAVVGVMTLATNHPWAAATVAGILLLIGIVAVVWLLRRIVSIKRRYDDWGTRRRDAEDLRLDGPGDPR